MTSSEQQRHSAGTTRATCQCGSPAKLLDTRVHGQATDPYRWRRWLCLSCGARFTTKSRDLEARLPSPKRVGLLSDAAVEYILSHAGSVRTKAERLNCSPTLVHQVLCGRRYAAVRPDLARHSAAPQKRRDPALRALKRACINCTHSAGLAGCTKGYIGPAQLCSAYEAAP